MLITGRATSRPRASSLESALSLPELQRRAEQLRVRVDRLRRGASVQNVRRARFLSAQLTAAVTRLRMLRGEKLSFDDEALGLFGLRPQLKPWPPTTRSSRRSTSWCRAPVRCRTASMPSRTVSSIQNRPAEAGVRRGDRRLQGADGGAHRACPRASASTSPSSPARAGAATIITRAATTAGSRSTPTCRSAISRAVDLGCHEGYPGHHVLNALLEQRLTRGPRLGRIQRLSALFAAVVDCRRLGQLRHRPGLPRGARRWHSKRRSFTRWRACRLLTPNAIDALLDALKELSGARLTIARELLDGTHHRAAGDRATAQIPPDERSAGRSSRSPSPSNTGPM